MHTFIRSLLVVAFALSTFGCTTMQSPRDHTFVLVRHAEKATDNPRDPALSPLGAKRAQRLAAQLHRRHVVAVYATAYQRTQQTAAPTARDHRLPVQTYDAAMEPSKFSAQLRDAPPGLVLVVGHSNTIPQLAAALCSCAVSPIADTQFGRRITIHVDARGAASLDDRFDP